MSPPKLLAMLSKQGIEGDDALLRLAQTRLQEAALGAELYPGSPQQLQQQLGLRPAGRPATVHLPRDINLLQPEGLGRMMQFAVLAAGRTDGMIVHDHKQFEEWPDHAITALREADRQLAATPGAPWLFVEYAAGLPPNIFARLFESTHDLGHVSACVDISHVGIQVCRTAYEQAQPGVDVCSLKMRADLPERIEGIQAAVASALPAVISLVQRLGRIGKPLHFHLHDGHPLSTLSRYGVSDHLGFLQEIRLPFAYQGRHLLGGMFGPAGLREIVATALQALPADQLSFMIEVHPQEGRTPLGAHGALFSSWRDLTNAQRMNYWLDALLQNATLLREACDMRMPLRSTTVKAETTATR